jgi:hypothetical protein
MKTDHLSLEDVRIAKAELEDSIKAIVMDDYSAGDHSFNFLDTMRTIDQLEKRERQLLRELKQH